MDKIGKDGKEDKVGKDGVEDKDEKGEAKDKVGKDWEKDKVEGHEPREMVSMPLDSQMSSYAMFFFWYSSKHCRTI